VYCRFGYYLLDIDTVMIDPASHLFKNLGLPIWAEFCVNPQQMDNRFFAFVSALSEGSYYVR
jgi:hypothetical protein